MASSQADGSCRPADSPGGVQVIARVGQVLRALDGEHQGLSLAQMADRIGLPRSTVHRIVTALAAYPPEVAARMLPGVLERCTGKTETDRAALLEVLEVARQTGVVYNREEATAASAPRPSPSARPPGRCWPSPSRCPRSATGTWRTS